MKQSIITYLMIFLIALLITGCQQKRQKVSEEIERDVETLTNRINDLDKQLKELRKSVESLKKDVDSRMSEIDSTMKRVESSRFEAKMALEDVTRRIKGEKKLTVAERKMLPIGVRIILIIIIFVLLVILIKKATARPYAPGAGVPSGEPPPPSTPPESARGETGDISDKSDKT